MLSSSTSHHTTNPHLQHTVSQVNNNQLQEIYYLHEAQNQNYMYN